MNSKSVTVKVTRNKAAAFFGHICHQPPEDFAESEVMVTEESSMPLFDGLEERHMGVSRNLLGLDKQEDPGI